VKINSTGSIGVTKMFRLHVSGLALALISAGTFSSALLAPSAVMTAQANDGKVAIRSTAAGSQRVKLGLNKSVVIDLPSDAYDILVANPTVADAVTRTARRIYLFGKSVGETNIYVFGPNGEQIVSLDLAVERDVAGLEDYLERFIPNSDITVELLNDNVVLTGTVETPLDAARARPNWQRSSSPAVKRRQVSIRRRRPAATHPAASTSTIPTRNGAPARSSTC
jgi:pilus assembly protein CpaC